MWGSFKLHLTCWKSYPLSFVFSLFFFLIIREPGIPKGFALCTLLGGGELEGWKGCTFLSDGIRFPINGVGEEGGGGWGKIPHFPSWNRCSNTLSTCFSGHRLFQVPGDDNRLKQWHNQDTPMNPAFICRKKALRDYKTIRLLIELVPHSDPAVSPRWDRCVWDTSKDGSWWSVRTDAAPGQLFTGVGCQNDFCDCPLS